MVVRSVTSPVVVEASAAEVLVVVALAEAGKTNCNKRYFIKSGF